MSARFRIIHYVPDPFSGARVPIAALVEDKEKRVRVERSPFLPGPHCVGGRAASSIITMTLDDLRWATSFDVLPPTLGPDIHLDRARPIPESVDDPAQWVVDHVLPKRPVLAEDQPERAPAAQRRQSKGMRFFETWKVATYVETDYSGVELGIPADVAHRISHYVKGKERLLLMEPVIGAREDFSDELRHVSNAFLAWRKLLENHGARREPQFIAYVLEGRYGESAHAREKLVEAGAEVIDVDIPSERSRFLETIKRVADSGGNGPQGTFHV